MTCPPSRDRATSNARSLKQHRKNTPGYKSPASDRLFRMRPAAPQSYRAAGVVSTIIRPIARAGYFEQHGNNGRVWRYLHGCAIPRHHNARGPAAEMSPSAPSLRGPKLSIAEVSSSNVCSTESILVTLSTRRTGASGFSSLSSPAFFTAWQ